MKVSIDGIELLVEESDRYLQIDDTYDTELRRIWKRLKTDYANYDKWFCYHNTEIPYVFLDEIGAVIKDDSIELRLTADNFNYLGAFEAVMVTTEDFDEFAVHHDKCSPEIYWTSKRIARDISRWGMFTLKSGNQIDGYILLAMGSPAQSEIFCVNAADCVQYEVLIASAAKLAFDSGRKEILYMADDNTAGLTAALSVGFEVTGFYKGFALVK